MGQTRQRQIACLWRKAFCGARIAGLAFLMLAGLSPSGVAQNFDPSFDAPAATAAEGDSFGLDAAASLPAATVIAKPEGVQSPKGQPLHSRFLIDPAQLLDVPSAAAVGSYGGDFPAATAQGDSSATVGDGARSGRPPLLLGQVPVAARQADLGTQGRATGTIRSFLEGADAPAAAAPFRIEIRQSGVLGSSPQVVETQKKNPSFEEGFAPLGWDAYLRQKATARAQKTAAESETAPPADSSVAAEGPAAESETAPPADSSAAAEGPAAESETAPPADSSAAAEGPAAESETAPPADSSAAAEGPAAESETAPPADSSAAVEGPAAESETAPPADSSAAAPEDQATIAREAEGPAESFDENMPFDMLGFSRTLQEGDPLDPAAAVEGPPNILGEKLADIPDAAVNLTVDYPLYRVTYQSGEDTVLTADIVKGLKELAQDLKKAGYRDVVITASAYAVDASPSVNRQVALSRALLARSYFLEEGFPSSSVDLSSLDTDTQIAPKNTLTVLLKRN